MPLLTKLYGNIKKTPPHNVTWVAVAVFRKPCYSKQVSEARNSASPMLEQPLGRHFETDL